MADRSFSCPQALEQNELASTPCKRAEPFQSPSHSFSTRCAFHAKHKVFVLKPVASPVTSGSLMICMAFAVPASLLPTQARAPSLLSHSSSPSSFLAALPHATRTHLFFLYISLFLFKCILFLVDFLLLLLSFVQCFLCSFLFVYVPAPSYSWLPADTIRRAGMATCRASGPAIFGRLEAGFKPHGLP